MIDNIQNMELGSRNAKIGNVNVAAVKIGRLHGRNVYRVPVQINTTCYRTFAETRTPWFTVTAHSATDAANWVRDNYQHGPGTTIIAIGPKLGKIERFLGWHTVIGRAILGPREPYRQIDFL